jgi:FKBP-type peptidyl-prolyl cis-trans isomerase
MNNRQIITIIVVALAALAAGYFIGKYTSGPKTESQISLNNEADSINFFLGLNQGYALQGLPFEPDAELIYIGMNQVLNDSSEYDPMTAQNIFRELQISLADREAMAEQQETIENLEQGAQFLEENAKRDGVITTESGLQFEVIDEGSGPKPNETSEVTVKYEGSLVDGTILTAAMNGAILSPLI